MFTPRFSRIIVIPLVVTLSSCISNQARINNIAKEITVKIINEYGGGSGVIFKVEDNIYSVLTNWHVVEDVNKTKAVTIKTKDKEPHEAIKITRVRNLDLAIVTFKSNKKYRLATFADSDKLSSLETVYVAAFPVNNNSLDITQGKIRSIHENVLQNPEPKQGYALDYTNSVFGGMSGGAVFNQKGHIIAINGQHDIDSKTLVPFSRGIPINLFKKELYNVSKKQLLELTLKGHSSSVRSVAIDGNKIVSGSKDNTIKVWNLSTGSLERTLTGHSHWVESVAIDGNKIVSGSDDDTIKVWNLSTGNLEHTLTHYGVKCVAIDGNKIVSGSFDKTIKVWNLSTGSLERTLTGHSGWVNSVAIDGNKIVSGSIDDTIKVWNLSTGKLERTLKGHSGWVNSVAIDGNKIVSGSYDDTIKVWNLSTGKLERTLNHSNNVESVAIDGNKIVSGSWWNGTIKVWNLSTGELERTLNHRTESVAIDGDKIVSGSSNWDKTIKMWQLEN